MVIQGARSELGGIQQRTVIVGVIGKAAAATTVRKGANAKLARTNLSYTSRTYLELLPKADFGGIVTPCVYYYATEPSGIGLSCEGG